MSVEAWVIIGIFLGWIIFAIACDRVAQMKGYKIREYFVS